MQVDNTCNKLQTLHEYIDDTEVQPRHGTCLWSCQACEHGAGHQSSNVSPQVPAYVAVFAGKAQSYVAQVPHGCICNPAQDYLNIELDSHRNQLIQLELLLTAGMFAMAIVTLVAGLFGMNLNNKHEESYSAFVIVSGCCGGCLR